MEDTFVFKIELGNAAMQDPADIAHALENVARNIRDGSDEGPIRDTNGNRVGAYGYNIVEA